MDLAETLIVKFTDKILNVFLSKKDNLDSRFKVDTSSVIQRLKLHVERSNFWASEVSVQRLVPSSSIEDVYVDLEIENMASQTSDSGSEPKRISELNAFDSNFVLLGQPGAGKTTSLKSLYRTLSSSFPECESTPILVRARKLVLGDSLCSSILSKIGVIVITEVKDKAKVKEFERNLTALFLDMFSARVHIDGLDELPQGIGADFHKDLEYFLTTCTVARFFMCSRTASFRTHLPNVHMFQLKSLSSEDVKKVSNRLIGSESTKKLLETLQTSPYNGTHVRPLTLVQLCHVFLRKGGTLPREPRNIYRTLTKLFMEDWDIYRSVKRTSEFEDFDADRKQEFLEVLAFELARNGRRGYFSHNDLRDAYLAICEQFSLLSTQATNVCREIESHTGLIIELEDQAFEFYHLSFQEYLSGEYIVKSGEYFPKNISLFNLPSELAVSVGLSSNPGVLFYGIVRATFGKSKVYYKPEMNTIQLFIERMIAEKPNWKFDIRIGMAIVVLDTFLVFKNETCDWYKVMHDKVVLKSFKEFLKFCNTIARNDNIAIFPNYGANRNKPLEFDRYLIELGRKKEYVVSKNLLHQLSSKHG